MEINAPPLSEAFGGGFMAREQILNFILEKMEKSFEFIVQYE